MRLRCARCARYMPGSRGFALETRDASAIASLVALSWLEPCRKTNASCTYFCSGMSRMTPIAPKHSAAPSVASCIASRGVDARDRVQRQVGRRCDRSRRRDGRAAHAAFQMMLRASSSLIAMSARMRADRLVLDDRAAALDADFRVIDGGVVRGAADARG